MAKPVLVVVVEFTICFWRLSDYEIWYADGKFLAGVHGLKERRPIHKIPYLAQSILATTATPRDAKLMEKLREEAKAVAMMEALGDKEPVTFGVQPGRIFSETGIFE